MSKRLRFVISILTGLVLCDLAVAKTVEYDLKINENSSHELTINGSSPGPVLRFTEGDQAIIRIHNDLNTPTSLHWHGVLVPNAMDGVPYLTYAPIAPHATFTYRFPIHQSGTYWYHSHTGFQEQQGVYGAIVIKKRKSIYSAAADHTIVLSDWSRENPLEVMRTLKRGSDWYSIKKGTAQSIWGAIQAHEAGNYFKRELLRMPAMDLSDVAYDQFLANGKQSATIAGASGKTVRLRLVNGSSMTNFYLKFAGGPMRIISADGQDVKPLSKSRFLIAVAETYDVLVQVPASGAYELRATAVDGSGYASVWLGAGGRHVAPGIPKPDLYSFMGKLSWARMVALTPLGAMGMTDAKVHAGDFDKPAMKMKMSMDMGDMTTEMGDMSMHMPKIQPENPRPPPPYADLQSLEPTAFPARDPVHVIRLTLDGDMTRYVWFLNNELLSPDNTIRIKKGEVVRFVLINRTMMDHPMHLHGHFFRVLNGHGQYSPLKHTVDVAPMSTTVIEFKTDEMGDWFFHCHLLYHMHSGMARLVHYEGFAPAPDVAALRSKFYHDDWYAWGQADVLSQMSEGFVTAEDSLNTLKADWEAGWNRHEAADWENVATYSRYVNRFFNAFAGGDFFGRGKPFRRGRGILGVRYLLPMNLESRLWVDSSGGGRINLEKTLHLLPRWELTLGAEYDTHDAWYGRVRLAYVLAKSFSGLVQWKSDYGWGAGVEWRF